MQRLAPASLASGPTLALAVLAVAAAVLPASPARADYEAGKSAYDQGDFAAAVREWKPLAEAGDARAQYRLGIMYAAGDGVDISLREAVRLYTLAAEGGLADAQNALAFMYRVGNGVVRSNEQALKWYRRAAEQGIGQAQYNLGAMIAGGDGTPIDRVEAYMWLSLATMHRVDEARSGVFQCADGMTAEEIAEAQRRALAWRPK